MRSPSSTLARTSEKIPRLVFGLCAITTLLILAGIFGFLIAESIGAFRQISFTEFVFEPIWNPTAYGTPSWGILSLLAGTALVSIIAMLFAAPLGLGVAIYMSEIARPQVREILKPIIESIATIPTVTLGLLGLLFVGPLVAQAFHLSNGVNALTAGLLVGVAALPTIASVCEDALSNVNTKYREPSLALGATRWVTIKRAIIPAAGSGIVAGMMLGLGRIIGETMIVLMVAGNALSMPNSIFDSVRPLPANLAIEIKEVVVGSLHWEALFATGLILFILTFAINLAADLAAHKKS